MKDADPGPGPGPGVSQGPGPGPGKSREGASEGVSEPAPQIRLRIELDGIFLNTPMVLRASTFITCCTDKSAWLGLESRWPG